MTTIGIVGCGAVGQSLLKAAESGALTLPIVAITSRTEETARAFLATLKQPPEYVSRDELIARSDLVVEAAGGSVVPDLARATFEAGKDLMAISIGALLDHPETLELAKERGCKLYAPSGAIAGLDGIKSASTGRIDHVTMTTRKPLKALEGSPYLVERGVSVLGFTEEQEIFSGTAREACRGFPANVNVSAAVSLAGIGPDLTRIRIIAVPGLERNCHDIEVEGEFGRLHIEIENIPTENPRTGRLTVMSLIRTLQGIADPLQIGT
jgi:aspartate dehydrogenase